MKTPAGSGAPFEVGERVAPTDLVGWNYMGLCGMPGKPNATRRYVKGMWVLQLVALANKKQPARVLSLRTETEDKQWWSERPAASPKGR